MFAPPFITQWPINNPKQLMIYAIPALIDNYIWLIVNQKSNQAVAIDPGEAKPVINFLNHHLNLQLTHILLTHHHQDHTGGVMELVSNYQCQLIGPAKVIDNPLTMLAENQKILQLIDFDVKVLATGGHTLDHVCYVWLTEPAMLFCGDTLFHAGCGRIFEGTAEQMWQSLQRLQQWPADTLVFAGHEYSAKNLQFAQLIEPHNRRVLAAQKRVQRRLTKHLPSLPSCLAWERQVNPFYRLNEPELKQAVQKKFAVSPKTELEYFTLLRQWKNQF